MVGFKGGLNLSGTQKIEPTGKWQQSRAPQATAAVLTLMLANSG